MAGVVVEGFAADKSGGVPEKLGGWPHGALLLLPMLLVGAPADQ